MLYENRVRKRLLDEQTPYERQLYHTLDELGVQYTPQHIFPYGNNFIVVDCYIPSYDIVIELDGLHHCLDPVKCAEDTARDKYLLDAFNLTVIRYMNSLTNDKKMLKRVLEDLVNPLRQTKLR